MKTQFLRMTSAVLLSLMFVSFAIAKSDDVSQSFDVAPGGTLNLDSDSGSVEVESHNKNTVEVTVENRSSDDGFTVNFKQSGNDVSVIGEREKSSWFGQSSRVRYTIKVPQDYNVTLQTGGGSIDLSDLNGEVDVRTSGGSISLGKIRGDVQAKTSGGSIRVDEVAGNIVAHTSGGSIKATLTKQPTADCKLTTSGGSITAYLASDVVVNLYAKTSGGGVSSDFKVNGYFSKKKLEGEINGGGPELHLKTSGGSVRVKEI